VSSGPALVVLAAGLGRRFGGLKQLAPVGPGGEAIVDYAVRDALAAGFGPIVLVVRSEIEPAVRAHVRRHWPAEVEPVFAGQDRDPSAQAAIAAGRTKPLGTAQAVLAGVVQGRVDGPFGVVNADDLYGAEAYRLLAGHLENGAAAGSALVTFSLASTLLGDGPVNRALCEVRAGRLAAVHEGVVGPGLRWTARSTGQARTLTGHEPVSMNCWGLAAAAVPVLADAVARFAASDGVAAGDEVLLPDVIAELIGAGHPVAALASSGPCIGVTHPGDLDAVRRLVAGPAW
jgi:dTDP-glucose pyrophosphorylase